MIITLWVLFTLICIIPVLLDLGKIASSAIREGVYINALQTLAVYLFVVIVSYVMIPDMIF